MNIAHLSRPKPNMSQSDKGAIALERHPLVGNHWSPGGFWVNSSFVKGGLKSFALFKIKKMAILPMTAKAGSAVLEDCLITRGTSV